MFNFRKIAAFAIGILTITMNVGAFGGYTHYYITSKVIEETTEFQELTDEEKLAYKSGCAVADIGWWN